MQVLMNEILAGVLNSLEKEDKTVFCLGVYVIVDRMGVFAWQQSAAGASAML